MNFQPLFALLVLILFLPCGCASHDEPRLPRAQPAFMQWMMRESLKEQAQEMIAEVSQSSRLWLNSGEGHAPGVLLKAAPVWLEVNPRLSASKLPIFRVLAAETDNIARFGFSGIFLGPTGERPEIWARKEMGGAQAAHAFGRNAASLKFDPSAGSTEDFDRLAARAEGARIQLGSDLIGSATGIGPDFLLAARKAAGYGGLYAMLPAPEDVWNQLPEAADEWDFQPLDSGSVESLIASGVLPSTVGREHFAWASKSGWAVTGPIIGVDGKARRWLYRYSGTEMNPVMSWHDPSGSARQAFSGAIIASTGLNRESLVGIRLEPLLGLEAAHDAPNVAKRKFAPMLGALGDIASEIHRYGGWALQADPLPVDAIEAVLGGPCDFCRDAVTPALVASAMLDGNAVPLANLQASWLAKNLPQNRLARGLNDGEGILWNVAPQGSGPSSFDEVYQKFSGGSGKGATPGAFYEILFAWRLGLPGFAFISANEMDKLGENFTSSILSRSSREKQDAFTARLRKLLETRGAVNMANGRVVAASNGANGAIGILSALPAGGYWLMACNFGDKRTDVQINLPQKATGARDAATGANLSALVAGSRLRVPLEGRQARHVLVLAKGMPPQPPAQTEAAPVFPDAPLAHPEDTATSQTEIIPPAPVEEDMIQPGPEQIKAPVSTDEAKGPTTDMPLAPGKPNEVSGSLPESPAAPKKEPAITKAKPAPAAPAPESPAPTPSPAITPVTPATPVMPATPVTPVTPVMPATPFTPNNSLPRPKTLPQSSVPAVSGAALDAGVAPLAGNPPQDDVAAPAQVTPKKAAPRKTKRRKTPTVAPRASETSNPAQPYSVAGETPVSDLSKENMAADDAQPPAPVKKTRSKKARKRVSTPQSQESNASGQEDTAINKNVGINPQTGAVPKRARPRVNRPRATPQASDLAPTASADEVPTNL